MKEARAEGCLVIDKDSDITEFSCSNMFLCNSSISWIGMKVPLEFHVTLPPQPLVMIQSSKPAVTIALGCFFLFCFYFARVDGGNVKVFRHGLIVPCA